MYKYEYPRPALTVDIAVFRKKETAYQLLLIQRAQPPYKNYWALPGGFLDMDETLEEAASRELLEETSLKCDALQQFKAYSEIGRDPRGRTVSVVFHTFEEAEAEAKAADDAKALAWFELDKLPELAFDHKEIITELREKLGL